MKIDSASSCTSFRFVTEVVRPYRGGGAVPTTLLAEFVCFVGFERPSPYIGVRSTGSPSVPPPI